MTTKTAAKARTKTAAKHPAGIQWVKSLVRYGCQSYFADVPVGLLKLKDGNPVGRHTHFLKSPYKTKQFQKTLDEAGGPVAPVIVTGFRSDGTFQVVDGNSRAAGALLLFGENYPVSVLLVEGADPDKLYSLLNHAGGARPIAARSRAATRK